MREFAMLRHVFAANRDLDSRVVIPPGDDMALLRLTGVDLLVAVDQVVAGRHFDPTVTPVELIGRKSVTRSLSDVAAMACRPVGTLVAVVLPPDFGEDDARRLFDSMRETAARYDSPLVGGDIAVHGEAAHPLVCSTTVLAEPSTGDPVTRSGARVGDDVYVTGRLGGSRDADGLGRHLTFEPRLEAAAELARTLGDRLHAMIDLSDGLGRDAAHIGERSDVRIELDADLIPLAPGVPDWRSALADGEDYELCFAVPGVVPRSVATVPVTRVGRVIPRPKDPGASHVVIRTSAGLEDASSLGWEHGG